jgi:hypothetical protein
MRGNKIINLREPTAWSDVATKGFIDDAPDSVLDGDLNLTGHKNINIPNPVDAQDAVTMSCAEATYAKRGGELDMVRQKFTNVADPTSAQDVATRN